MTREKGNYRYNEYVQWLVWQLKNDYHVNLNRFAWNINIPPSDFGKFFTGTLPFSNRILKIIDDEAFRLYRPQLEKSIKANQDYINRLRADFDEKD